MTLRSKCFHGRSIQAAVIALSVVMFGFAPPSFSETHLDTLRRTFSNLRLGQFLHFGMNTFSNSSGSDLPNQDPALYAPTSINPAQWVSAAKAGGVKFMVLVCKHHDGFALWDTKVNNPGATYNPYCCMNSRVPAAARQDVVKLFVQACRDSGIVPGLYFSVQDRTYGGPLYINSGDRMNASGVTNGRISRAALNFVFTQVKELLSNYGDIPFFVDDGWAWSMGHTIVPYQEFQDTLRKFGPNTLFSEHEGLFYPWHEDLIYYENSKGVWPPANQKYASWLSNKMGGAWFWLPTDAGKTPLAISSFISTYLNVCDPVWCNVTPNLPPDRDGLIQDTYVAWLKQLGQTWTPPASRAQLPAQGPHMDYVITAVNATATSNASAAHYAVDGLSDGGFATYYTQSLWTSSGALPQSVTVDLGAAYYNIEMCDYLPKQIARQDTGGFDSSAIITGYKIYYSLDNTAFTPVTLNSGYDGAWTGDNTLKYAMFTPVHARYMRLEATAVRSGSAAIVSEVDFGGYTVKPTLTGVQIKEPHFAPVNRSGAPRTSVLTMINGENGSSRLTDAVYAGNSVVYYGLDGRKLFQRGNGAVRALPGSSSSKVCAVKQ
ncbi:MAG: alpha-L-fucosidase [Chitinivibrionales bacterium]